MPKNSILDWSLTDASNTDIGGVDINEGCPAAGINDAIRKLMAQVKAGVDYKTVLSTKSGNYTALANDNNAFIRFSAAATLTLTAAATLGANWHCWVMADGGAVVIDPNASETINGASTITIPDGSSTLVICDGTNFRALEDYLNLQPSIDVASAATTDIGAAASQNVRITGTTTITSLGTAPAGMFRRVRFAGALTLTHNATSLILPNAVNITTVAGDIAEFVSEGSGNWRCLSYTKAAQSLTNKFLASQETSSLSATTTTAFATPLSAGVTFTPSSPSSRLFVQCTFQCNLSKGSDAIDDLGSDYMIKQFDGTSYQDTTGSGSIRSTNIGTNGARIYYNTTTVCVELTPAQRRSDSGAWTVRLYGNVAYSGNTFAVTGIQWFFHEYDPT